MSDSESDSKICHNSEGTPVMFCKTAVGRLTKPLGRGSTPSTPRRGRSEKRRLSELIAFRCTKDDRVTIKAHAESSGLEQSAYLRLQALGKSKIRRRRRVNIDWDELRRCMGVINKAGNVVNQLVVQLRCMRCESGLANITLTELRETARAIAALLRVL